MSLRSVFTFQTPLYLRIHKVLSKRCYASTTNETDEVVDLTTVDEAPIYAQEENISEEYEKKRNKSRLERAHRNILLNKKPYGESMIWYHDTLKYKRKLLGRYGIEAVGVPAGIAWPTVDELQDMKEYERVAFPYTIQERWSKIEQKNKEAAEQRIARDKDITMKMEKSQELIDQLNKKILAKEAAAQAAKARKDRIIDEVMRHFGYNISVHDEKFIKMFEQKVKEDKKRQKLEKKKLKEEKELQKMKNLMAKNKSAKGATTPEEEATQSVVPEETALPVDKSVSSTKKKAKEIDPTE